MFDVNKLRGQVDLYKIKEDKILVPTIESAFPYGLPEDNNGNIIYQEIYDFLVNDVKNPYLIRAKGDSMIPIIKERDELICETIGQDGL